MPPKFLKRGFKITTQISKRVTERFDSTTVLCQIHSYKYTYRLCLVKQDIESLRPECWLNDQIVNFLIADVTNAYVEALLGQKDDLFVIPSTSYHGYVQNTDRLSLPIPTFSRNLFTYDFIAIPVNVNDNHWILAIICYVPDLNPDVDAAIRSSIIILDSLGGKHPGVVKRLKNLLVNHLPLAANYIWQPPQSLVAAMPTYYPSVPQQPNYFDCGLYPPHLLGVFMNDPHQYFRHCAGLESIEEDPIIVWGGCDGKAMRAEARQRVKLHVNCYRLVRRRKQAGLDI
ncbi:hypothetical protein FRC03_005180 [Tulasnella sp. 419]|nr:hypothetical protein FRC03_005180 [Tulasnella sp. 419]